LPLHTAINNNNTELARVLLETHTSEQIKALTKEHGDGAIHLAARKSNIEIVMMLVENGAAVNVNTQNVRFFMISSNSNCRTKQFGGHSFRHLLKIVIQRKPIWRERYISRDILHAHTSLSRYLFKTINCLLLHSLIHV